MRNENDFLSEFEQEFELDQYAGEQPDFISTDGELEDEDFEWEQDDEYLDEFEVDKYDELEQPYQDEDPYARDQEFEDRLYNAIHSATDNELEMEMEVGRILHEMEQDYFFGSLKKWAKKKGLGLLKKAAGNLPMARVIRSFSRLPRGFIRKALSNNLLRTGIGMIPGYGPAISQGMNMAQRFLNSEINTPGVSRDNIRQVVQVGKQAYQNLADDLLNMSNLNAIQDMGRNALKRALHTTGGGKSSSFKNKRKREIPVPPGSIVTVHPNKVIIWQS